MSTHARTTRRKPPAPRRRSRRRARARRGVGRWIALVCAVVVLAAAAVGGWMYSRLSGNITGADIADTLGDDRPSAGRGGRNILVIGSDSRKGLGDTYGKNLTTMQSDTLMVLHTAGDGSWATVVSLPRDSWVPIPSCEQGGSTRSQPHTSKINEAFATGGSTGDTAKAAACTIKTVEANTGLRIDNFMIVDFRGFTGMVNALDGVEICPKEPVRDKKAGLDLPAGCQTVKDEQALAYVRARYSVGDGSDIGRIGRQQEFMESLARRAKDKLYSPTALYGFLDAATKSLTTDKELADLKTLTDLATQLKGIPAERIAFVTVPNYPRERDLPSDKANVTWQQPAARQLFTALTEDREVTKADLAKSSADLPVAAGRVQVKVLNATGVSGRAQQVAEQLRGLGFQVVATGNAPAATKSSLTYPAGMELQAKALAGRLPGLTAEQSGAGSASVLVLTVGPELPPPS